MAEHSTNVHATQQPATLLTTFWLVGWGEEEKKKYIVS